jgi:hypothetical protein
MLSIFFLFFITPATLFVYLHGRAQDKSGSTIYYDDLTKNKTNNTSQPFAYGRGLVRACAGPPPPSPPPPSLAYLCLLLLWHYQSNNRMSAFKATPLPHLTTTTDAYLPTDGTGVLPSHHIICTSTSSATRPLHRCRTTATPTSLVNGLEYDANGMGYLHILENTSG